MAAASKAIGLIGLGNMGGKIAEKLYNDGYSLVLYNKTKDEYVPFDGRERTDISSDLKDFAKRLRASKDAAIVWIMVPGGAATNTLVAELSMLLGKGDIVIDGSNSVYQDSVANHDKLKAKGIFYLDVGCGGGPEDLLNGVTLMVGGERTAFERVEDILRIVAGNGAYGYLGKSGSGHMAKLVHNIVFYGIFPVYVEGTELLLSMKSRNYGGDFDVNEALRLLEKSPPINTGIMKAVSTAVRAGRLPDSPPQMTVSEIVKHGIENADRLGVHLTITSAVLSKYASMSEESRKIYSAAKRIITSH